jgi:hypothetical protein
VGFGCLARSPGERKSSFFLWLFGTFLAMASPICVLQSLLRLAAARHFFRTEQFGGIYPHFFLFLSFPASLLHPRHHSRIRFEILLSIVLITSPAHFFFPQACRKEVLDPNMKSLEVWKDVRARESTL